MERPAFLSLRKGWRRLWALLPGKVGSSARWTPRYFADPLHSSTVDVCGCEMFASPAESHLSSSSLHLLYLKDKVVGLSSTSFLHEDSSSTAEWSAFLMQPWISGLNAKGLRTQP